MQQLPQQQQARPYTALPVQELVQQQQIPQQQMQQQQQQRVMTSQPIGGQVIQQQRPQQSYGNSAVSSDADMLSVFLGGEGGQQQRVVRARAAQTGPCAMRREPALWLIVGAAVCWRGSAPAVLVIVLHCPRAALRLTVAHPDTP